MKKYLLSIILIFIAAFIFVPSIFADDNRIVVTAVEMTSDMEIPTYGGSVHQSYSCVTTVGSPAYMSPHMGHWYRYDGSKWVRYNAGLFREGKYYYYDQIRIDDKDAVTHKLSLDTTLKVDGIFWTNANSGSIADTFSYRYYQSPEYVVERDEEFELSFGASSDYNIPDNNVGIAIESFSVIESVLGGVGEYTFSKTSGPEWISVSENGTISGTPVSVGDNSDLVVRVTDEEASYREITITVGHTYINPADRTKVLAAKITSNMEVPTYGGENKSEYTYTTIEGEPIHMTPHMGHWYKQNGESWSRYDSETFVEGTYRYSNQIRIDGAQGYTHILSEETTLIVDGEEWVKNGSLSYGNNFSYMYYRSPEYVVKMPVTVVFNTNGGSNISNQNIFKGDKAVRPDDPTMDDGIFEGWFANPELTIPFDFDTTINENTIVYAKWTIVLHKLYATITAPVNDKHPDFTPVSANPEAYRVEFMHWSYTFPTYTELTSEDVFVAGKTYDVAIRFVANEGYEISGGADFYINNEESTTAYNLGTERGMSFTAEDAVITSFNITGIVAPKGSRYANAANVNITTPGVTLRELRWLDEAENQQMEATDKFVPKRKYVLVLEFDKNEGYVFADGIGEDEISTNENYLMAEFIKERPEIRLYYEATESLAITSAPKVKVTNANDNTLLVSYNEPDNTEEFEIYRSTSKTKNFKKIATVTTNSYIDTGLTYGKTYYYKVKAINEKSNKTSSVVSGKTVPNKVENVLITSAGSNNVKISYDKVNVNGYEVYYGTSTKKMKKATTISKNSTLTYNKTKLKSNTTYYFEVRAYKKVGRKKVYGAWSNIVSTKTAPAKPTLSVSVKDYKSLNVKLNSSKGSSVYKLEVSEDKNNYSLVEEYLSSGTFAQNDLTTGKTYYYRVKVCNALGNCSGYSKVVSKKVVPAKPSVSVSSPLTKQVLVKLTKQEGTVGYEIYRSTRKNRGYKKIATLLDEESVYEYLDTTSKRKTYYYKVRTYTTVEETKVYSSYSSIKKIRSK